MIKEDSGIEVSEETVFKEQESIGSSFNIVNSPEKKVTSKQPSRKKKFVKRLVKKPKVAAKEN